MWLFKNFGLQLLALTVLMTEVSSFEVTNQDSAFIFIGILSILQWNKKAFVGI